jgi:protein tyrosine phosphatase (PTP) superfamily phosphohydrolase (DUF442 family)
MPVRRVVERLLAVTLLAAASSVTSADVLGELVNYREYSPILSSSGQPTAEQLKDVRDAGFDRVVFLAPNDSEGSLGNEDRIVESLGMQYAHIPVDWDAPQKSDFDMFAGLMSGEPDTKTLVHCQVNFRASTFSFLYRVVHLGVPIDEAKDALNSVWVPNETWRQLIFQVLEDNGIAPDCPTCLWE